MSHFSQLFALLPLVLATVTNAAVTTLDDANSGDALCIGGVSLPGIGGALGECCVPPSVVTWLDKTKGFGKCCPVGHAWTGDNITGIGGCCPSGFSWITGQCKPAEQTPTPDNGPKDHRHNRHHHHSHHKHTDRNVCRFSGTPVCASNKDLGIEYGHCYILTFTDGVQLGAQRDDTTYAKGGYFQDIPFKVCKSTSDCSEGGPVPSNGTFFLQDQNGRFNDAKATKGWINNASGGTHIGFTTTTNQAGLFKGVPACSGGRCALRLGGGPTGNGGIAPTCPMPNHGLTFWPNPRVSMMLSFTETACDGPDAPFLAPPPPPTPSTPGETPTGAPANTPAVTPAGGPPNVLTPPGVLSSGAAPATITPSVLSSGSVPAITPPSVLSSAISAAKAAVTPPGVLASPGAAVHSARAIESKFVFGTT